MNNPFLISARLLSPRMRITRHSGRLDKSVRPQTFLRITSIIEVALFAGALLLARGDQVHHFFHRYLLLLVVHRTLSHWGAPRTTDNDSRTHPANEIHRRRRDDASCHHRRGRSGGRSRWRRAASPALRLATCFPYPSASETSHRRSKRRRSSSLAEGCGS